MVKKIGPYEIVSELGRGGMGVVYKAREESLQRYVAIKMLGNQLVQDEQVSERFMREARVVADLNHPNLVQVFRVDRHEDQPYFVMEYVEGDSLKALIQRERQMQPARALQILQEVANGLGAAHDKGVIHRDIKPENIMLSKYGGVKVVDFGIARDENAETRLTTTGIGLGTPSYLSPEVCLSRDVDQRSDIFSLGVVLFEMLTGDIPFKSDSPFEMMTKVVEAKVPDIKDLNPSVDEGIKKILAKMIAKRPKLRYQHCNELISDIEDYRAGREPRWAKNVDLGDTVETALPKPTSAPADTPTVAATAHTPSTNSPPTLHTAPPTEDTESFDNASGGSRKGLAVAAMLLVLVISGAAVSSWYLLSGSDKPLLAWFGGGDSAAETNELDPVVEPSQGSSVASVSDDEVPAAVEARIDRSANGSVEPDAADDGATKSTPAFADAKVQDQAPEDPSASAIDRSESTSSQSAPVETGFQFAVEPESGDASTANEGTGRDASASNESSQANALASASDRTMDSAEAGMTGEASEQPPSGVEGALDMSEAVASVAPGSTSASPSAPAWNPAAPRIIVMAAGDPAVADPVEQVLEQGLNRASFELMDEDLMDGMAYAETLPDIARAALEAGADILVFADVVPAGERELNFYGRTDYQYLANLQVRVVVLHERRNLGPMVRERLEYVALNADEKARQASRLMVSDIVTRLRALRAGAASAAG